MSAIPSPEDFRTLDEVIVHAPNTADELGRERFTAFWLADQPWVPNGVRAQVFHTVLAEFIGRHDQPVRVIRDVPS